MEKKLSDLLSKAKVLRTKIFSFLNFWKKSRQLLEYKTITLRDYITISETGNIELLGGNNEAERLSCWDAILAETFKASNSLAYENKLDEYKKLFRFTNDLIYIKAAILKLHFVVDDELISELRSKGYHINTSNSKVYAQSLFDAYNKSKNLISKMKSARAKLMEEINDNEATSITFEGILVNLSHAVGYPISRDLLLCEFNEYRKLINKKNTPKKQVA